MPSGPKSKLWLLESERRLIDIAFKQSRTSGGEPRGLPWALVPRIAVSRFEKHTSPRLRSSQSGWKPGYGCVRRSYLIKDCPTTIRRISLANGNPATKRDPVPNTTLCNAWRLEINGAVISLFPQVQVA